MHDAVSYTHLDVYKRQVWKWMLLFVILALMYLTSVYVRVSKKHLTQLRRRRRRGKSVGLLPT